MFFIILIFLIFVLLVEDVCLIFCEFGLFVYSYCLIVKKIKCDIKKYWLMVVFKYYINSVYIYKGFGNFIVSNSGCLI